jgi:hypothetical protein
VLGALMLGQVIGVLFIVATLLLALDAMTSDESP